MSGVAVEVEHDMRVLVRLEEFEGFCGGGFVEILQTEV